MKSATLAERVDRLRTAVDPGPLSRVGEIPEFDIGLSHDLYRLLVQPMKEVWDGATELLIVADGPLGFLPFSLLATRPEKAANDGVTLFDRYRSVAWMARELAITNLPSVSALIALSSVQTADAPSNAERRPFVGIADPFFSPAQASEAETVLTSVEGALPRGFSLRNLPDTRSARSAGLDTLPRLPDTRDEVLSISRVLKADANRDLFLGERASEALLKDADLSVYSVISFATHGLVPGDLDGLDQPALALSSPEITGEKDDGLLTINEILGLKLNADFTVLSACNTAAADGKGVQAVSGQGRAFLYAGSRSILVSNWPVHSGATTDLMSNLFMALGADRALTRTEALRRAMVTLIDKGGFKHQGSLAYSCAHPIFWAPFSLVGDGGSANPAIN